MKHVALAIALLAVPLAGCVNDTADPDPPAQAPDWSFTDLDGQNHSRVTSEGSPTVLFFMATWCGSCRAMTDDLAQVHDGYSDRGVDIYSVSFDPSEGEDDLRQWKERYEQPWPHGIDQGSQIAQTFDVRSQSSVIILDAQGVPAETWGYGAADASSMSQVLDRLLG